MVSSNIPLGLPAAPMGVTDSKEDPSEGLAGAGAWKLIVKNVQSPVQRFKTRLVVRKGPSEWLLDL